ncbi:hypothetical protein Goari_002789, partial [Gossypium aridum]|nr:hypothetical protein [Gossypium aridum]
ISKDIIRRIVSIPPSHLDACPDRIAWNHFEELIGNLRALKGSVSSFGSFSNNDILYVLETILRQKRCGDREVNQVADKIAKMASANMEGVNVLTTIPKEVLEVLNNNKA